MYNFEFQNPVKLIFGKGSIARIAEEIPAQSKIMLTFGGGSVKRNGVYDQVIKALEGRNVVEFWGIEPNPKYETLVEAIALARREGVDFLLAVGGGSVIDGTKFIAAAIPYEGEAWDIITRNDIVRKAVPLATVLTLPATGSEMNNGAVISRRTTHEKFPFHYETCCKSAGFLFCPHFYPHFFHVSLSVCRAYLAYLCLFCSTCCGHLHQLSCFGNIYGNFPSVSLDSCRILRIL